MQNDADVRLAIVGCGAVTELAHLPAAQRICGCRVTLLVDPNRARREKLAATFGVAQTADDASALSECFDAAIVAAPHALHAPITIQLASLGKSVLVEKPMANTSGECQAMLEAAERNGTTLAVGLMRRFLWAHRLTKDLIVREVFGRVRSFEFCEGAIYYWPVASDFFFRKEAAGGGVLIDTGAHTLDTLLQWLGPVADLEYFDDAEGGVEANCLLKLRLNSGARGTVELSRTRSLRNTAIINLEHASLEVALAENRLKISLPDRPYTVSGPVIDADAPHAEQDYLGVIAEQMQDFVDATRTGRETFVAASSAVASIALIEGCYSRRQRLELAWDDFAVAETV